jgi:hypothetical protein
MMSKNWTLFKTALYMIRSSGFARPPDSNINSHILLDNRCVLQQQHVDCKIADALLKKGTKQHADGWDASIKARAHMVLHLPHAGVGFGVIFNDISKDGAFYTTTSRFVATTPRFVVDMLTT